MGARSSKFINSSDEEPMGQAESDLYFYDAIAPVVEADSLDLSEYCIGYDKHKSHFNLFGICNHIGSSNGGHYYSYCKNQNGKWYEFNDSNVKEISDDKLVTNNAYCLFYRKINNRLIK